MGGFGSGRRSYGKDLLEDHRSIDVHRWLREGLLRPGSDFTCYWGEGSARSSIGVTCNDHGLRLSYTLRDTGRAIDYTVPLSWTPCDFGGSRPWFVCPGRGCGRRVTKLYLLGGYFLCRYCQDLTYSCRGESRGFWQLRRAQRIRARLGGHTGLARPFPLRPPRMHRRTYLRLSNEALQLEREGQEAVDRGFIALTESLCRALGLT
jgi:hypothetical protein